VLPVQEHDVEIFGVRELAQFVDLLQRVAVLTRGHLRHQPVAIPRNAFQRQAEHAVHIAVGLGGLKEANAAIVGVAHQSRELVLAQLALYFSAKCPGAERQTRYLNIGISKLDPIGRCRTGSEGQACGAYE